MNDKSSLVETILSSNQFWQVSHEKYINTYVLKNSCVYSLNKILMRSIVVLC